MLTIFNILLLSFYNGSGIWLSSGTLAMNKTVTSSWSLQFSMYPAGQITWVGGSQMPGGEQCRTSGKEDFRTSVRGPLKSRLILLTLLTGPLTVTKGFWSEEGNAENYILGELNWQKYV